MDESYRTVIFNVYAMHGSLIGWGVNEGLKKSARQFFKIHDVQYEEEPPSEKGGGDGWSLRELVAALWKSGDLLSIPMRVARHIAEYFKWKFINANGGTSRPTVNVILRVKANSVRPNYYPSPGEVLAELKHLSDGLCTHLTREFSAFAFNQSISLSVEDIDFNATFWLSGEKRSPFNDARMLRQMRLIEPLKNRNYYFEITGLNLLKQTEITHGGVVDKQKTRYIIV